MNMEADHTDGTVDEAYLILRQLQIGSREKRKVKSHSTESARQKLTKQRSTRAELELAHTEMKDFHKSVSDSLNDIISAEKKISKNRKWRSAKNLYSEIESLCQKSVTTVEDDPGSTKSQSTLQKPTTIRTMWKKFARKASTTKKKNKTTDVNSPHMSDAGIDITLSMEKEQPPNIEQGNADPVYNLLKSASTLRKVNADGDSSGVSSMRSLPRQNTASSGRSGSSRSSSPGAANGVRSYGAGARPRQMLNQRMKSFSLDAPDVPKPVDSSTKVKSTSYTNNTCIPGVNSGPAHGRRRMQLMSERRGLSADLDDVTGGSHLSSNTSIPSNHSSPKNFPPRPIPHLRLSVQAERGQLPCTGDSNGNEYLSSTVQRGGQNNEMLVALYEFTAKESGDLSLRPGSRVALKDTSDPDWWLGSADGKTGYFPKRYVLPLQTGQRVYQVCKPLHLTAGDSEIRLLRDQVVIECGAIERSGMMLIQTKNIKTGHVYDLVCPQRYLAEI